MSVKKYVTRQYARRKNTNKMKLLTEINFKKINNDKIVNLPNFEVPPSLPSFALIRSGNSPLGMRSVNSF